MTTMDLKALKDDRNGLLLAIDALQRVASDLLVEDELLVEPELNEKKLYLARRIHHEIGDYLIEMIPRHAGIEGTLK